MDDEPDYLDEPTDLDEVAALGAMGADVHIYTDLWLSDCWQYLVAEEDRYVYAV